MNNRVLALAFTLAMTSVLAGTAFADNTQVQTSFGPISPNTSTGSNNDTLSHNNTDTNNYQPVASFNDFSTNDSFNVSVPITNSFNDSSTHVKDSHEDESVNQAAVGQVNLNNSYADDINAADNCSTIFDGDVKIGSSGGYGGYGYAQEGYGYGNGDSESNINTGIMANSIQGNESAQFTNVGVGANGSHVDDSSMNSGSVSNLNLLNP